MVPKDLQNRFHPDIRFGFRILTQDDGLTKFRVRKRKSSQGYKQEGRQERTADREGFRRFGIWL